MNCIINAWHHHEAELRVYLFRRLMDASLCEDILQDTFLKAIAEGSGFCQLDNPRAWLFRVTHNNMIDYLRRDKSWVELDENITNDEIKIEAVATLSRCLPKVLLELNPDDQEVIKLCDLEGMSQSEYAFKRNITLPATKSRIQRARVRLKQQLKRSCDVRFDENGYVCCFVPKK